MTRLKTRISPKGEATFTFVLNDGKGTIAIAGVGKPACQEGLVATVAGVFRAAKAAQKGGETAGRNQVDATRISC